MKIFVKVKPNAKKETVEKLDDAHFAVSVKAPPADSKANKAVLRLLADYFSVALSRLEIVAGHTARQKIIRIN